MENYRATSELLAQYFSTRPAYVFFFISICIETRSSLESVPPGTRPAYVFFFISICIETRSSLESVPPGSKHCRRHSREKMGERPEFLSTFVESPDCLEGTCHTQNQVDEGIEFVQKSHGCDFVFW